MKKVVSDLKYSDIFALISVIHYVSVGLDIAGVLFTFIVNFDCILFSQCFKKYLVWDNQNLLAVTSFS